MDAILLSPGSKTIKLKDRNSATVTLGEGIQLTVTVRRNDDDGHTIEIADLRKGPRYLLFYLEKCLKAIDGPTVKNIEVEVAGYFPERKHRV